MRSGRFRFCLTDPDDISNSPLAAGLQAFGPPAPRDPGSVHGPSPLVTHPAPPRACRTARVGGSGHQDGPRGNTRAALLHNGGYATCLSSRSPAQSGAPLLALACRQMTGISRNRALCKPGVPSAPASCRWHFAGPLPAAKRYFLQVFTHLAVACAAPHPVQSIAALRTRW